MEAGTTPPAIYNPPPSAVGKDSRALGIVVLSLRSALVLFTLIAFSVMAANKATIYGAYTSYYYTSYYSSTIKFSAVKAFVGLLSLDIIVCAYAIVQVVLSLVQVSSSGAFLSSPTSGGNMITFVFDLVLSYALVAAAAAAADSQAILNDDGSCDSLTGFCAKASASIAVSFLAWVLLAILTALYPVRLLRISK